jgi:hypothetical protein
LDSKLEERRSCTEWKQAFPELSESCSEFSLDRHFFNLHSTKLVH